MTVCESQEFHRADGRLCLMDLTATLIPWGRAQEAILATLQDITARKAVEEAMQRRNQQLAALNQISQAITASLDPQRIVETIASQAAALLGADGSGLYGWAPDSKTLVLNMAYGADQALVDAVRAARGQFGRGAVVSQAIAGQNPVYIPDVRDESSYQYTSPVPTEGYVGVIAAPMFSSNRVLGGICLWWRQPPTLSQEDLTLLQTLADQAAIALENARLFTEMERWKAFNENIVQGVAEAILIENAAGVVTFVNPALEELLGYTSAELVDHRWSTFIPEDEMAKVRRETAIQPQGLKSRYEMVLRHRDGPLISVIVSTRPLFESGAFVGTLSAVTDITQRQRAEEALREANRKIERLHEAAHRLQAANTEDELCQLTVEAAERILEFTMCQLGVVEKNELVTKAMSTGLPSEIGAIMSLETGPARESYHTGTTRICDNLDEAPQTWPRSVDFRSLLTAPIGDLGVFQVLSTEPNTFTEHDTRLLELLLGHTAQALKRIRLQDKLREQVIHDPLTGVYNRRYFNEMIGGELRRSSRHHHSIGFLMIDVNRFKEINDNYGHQVRDRVLHAMGKLFQETVRASDIIVRYGGDEFLIVFTETNGEVGAVAQRIRDAVARWNKGQRLVEFPITLAMGTSYWWPESEKSLELVLHEADQRMYEDKRKQVVTS